MTMTRKNPLKALGMTVTIIASVVAGLALTKGCGSSSTTRTVPHLSSTNTSPDNTAHDNDADTTATSALPLALDAAVTSNQATQAPTDRQYAYITSAYDLPEGMVLPRCPDNQRFVFTRPSGEYTSVHDGRLFACDIISGCKALIEMEFRRHHLSALEKQVARGIIYNDSNQKIGKQLFISESAVKYHVRNIYRKTDSANRGAFIHLIQAGIAQSNHSWRSRRELERDMEFLQVP